MDALQISPSHALVAEASEHLLTPCPPACRGHDVTRATGRILYALWRTAVESLDAAPDSMATRPYVESFLHAIPGWRPALLTAALVMGRDLLPEWRVGQQIRSLHPASFMTGEWGTIVGVEDVEGILCWAVRWPDGANDLWACHDPANAFEYREAWEEPGHEPTFPTAPDPTRIEIPEVPQ